MTVDSHTFVLDGIRQTDGSHGRATPKTMRGVFVRSCCVSCFVGVFVLRVNYKKNI